MSLAQARDLAPAAAAARTAAERLTFTGDRRRAVALPLGGIGTGNLALGGTGALKQWQLHNQGNHLGFAPFGKVTTGMAVVNKLYGGYDDTVTNDEPQIASQGNSFLKKHFPKLDSVIRARIVQAH